MSSSKIKLAHKFPISKVDRSHLQVIKHLISKVVQIRPTPRRVYQDLPEIRNLLISYMGQDYYISGILSSIKSSHADYLVSTMQASYIPLVLDNITNLYSIVADTSDEAMITFIKSMHLDLLSYTLSLLDVKASLMVEFGKRALECD